MAKVIDLDFIRALTRMTTRACALGWHEANGGNLSYRLAPEEVEQVRACQLAAAGPWLPLGISVPQLGGQYFVITGRGQYLRNVALFPESSLALLELDSQGQNYCLRWGLKNGGQPSSELPSHLLNQAIKKPARRVVYHAHPANIIALTFVLPPDSRVVTRALWAMMPECLMTFPEGLGVLPWTVPGGYDIARASSALMAHYNVVVWAQHGVFCAGRNFDETLGLMETVEKAAEIYLKVRAAGGMQYAPGLEDLRALARSLNLRADLDDE